MAETLPFRSYTDDEQRWACVTAEFAEQIHTLANELLTSLPSDLTRRVLSESKQEVLQRDKPTVSVAEFRLRPTNSYYTKSNRPLPRPENPRGFDATGLAVSLSVCRGFAEKDSATPPFIALDFEVWGAHERAGFASLLRDHRHLVEMLVTRSGASLFTSCPFKNIEAADYVSPFEALELYFANETDPENQFALQCKFGRTARETDIRHSLQIALALYDATMGYCLVQAQRERLLEHVRLGTLALGNKA
ncbi:hypothetical protein [Zoogloea sp.]|uniref:hypothetical protein n=1 Tax=Zoogloea sp. TaxID=49181 RepID=UPI0025DBC3D9|nr:hypothetical protein [Zoogloea sp.]MCK6408618.1 hypothetical protein [Thauera sp.]